LGSHSKGLKLENEFKFVEDIIKTGLTDATVTVEDMTGTKDHLIITVISDKFEGKLLFEQHQIIMGLLKDELSSRIHAVKLKTLTYDKLKKSSQG
jgi:stress-induced morphogen